MDEIVVPSPFAGTGGVAPPQPAVQQVKRYILIHNGQHFVPASNVRPIVVNVTAKTARPMPGIIQIVNARPSSRAPGPHNQIEPASSISNNIAKTIDPSLSVSSTNGRIQLGVRMASGTPVHVRTPIRIVQGAPGVNGSASSVTFGHAWNPHVGPRPPQPIPLSNHNRPTQPLMPMVSNNNNHLPLVRTTVGLPVQQRPTKRIVVTVPPQQQVVNRPPGPEGRPKPKILRSVGGQSLSQKPAPLPTAGRPAIGILRPLAPTSGLRPPTTLRLVSGAAPNRLAAPRPQQRLRMPPLMAQALKNSYEPEFGRPTAILVDDDDSAAMQTDSASWNGEPVYADLKALDPIAVH